VTDRDVREILHLLAPLLPTVEARITLRDPDDAPVVSAALAGTADAIVTGDLDILDDDDLRAWLRVRGIQVLSPTELIDRL
jgi:predicted nucleic acid-binding protein